MHQRTRVPVLGAPIDAIDMQGALSLIAHWAKHHEPRAVSFCNVHAVVTAQRDPAFAKAVSQMDLALPDGAPVAWQMRRAGHVQQARISGPDLMAHCLQDCALSGISVFLYGSTEVTLAALRAALQKRWPSLIIGGAESPPFRVQTLGEQTTIRARINASGAGIVLVGLGCPKQELWMAEQAGHIQAVMLGVGAAFDFFAGHKTRAPRWMRNAGLEWLHRLLTEPRRLGWRYVDTNSAFIFACLKLWLKLRLPGRLTRP